MESMARDCARWEQQMEAEYYNRSKLDFDRYGGDSFVDNSSAHSKAAAGCDSDADLSGGPAYYRTPTEPAAPSRHAPLPSLFYMDPMMMMIKNVEKEMFLRGYYDDHQTRRMSCNPRLQRFFEPVLSCRDPDLSQGIPASILLNSRKASEDKVTLAKESSSDDSTTCPTKNYVSEKNDYHDSSIYTRWSFLENPVSHKLDTFDQQRHYSPMSRGGVDGKNKTDNSFYNIGRVFQERDWKHNRIWREDDHTRTFTGVVGNSISGGQVPHALSHLYLNSSTGAPTEEVYDRDSSQTMEDVRKSESSHFSRSTAFRSPYDPPPQKRQSEDHVKAQMHRHPYRLSYPPCYRSTPPALMNYRFHNYPYIGPHPAVGLHIHPPNPQHNTERFPQTFKKRVSFGILQIRTYETILGDNPSCSSGPSLSIGWRYDPSHQVTSIDDYERIQIELYGDIEKYPEDLVLDRREREAILLSSGYTRRDLADAVRRSTRAKNRRRQTVHNIPVAWVEERLEACRRTVRRTIRKKKRTRHLYDEWKEANSENVSGEDLNGENEETASYWERPRGGLKGRRRRKSI